MPCPTTSKSDFVTRYRYKGDTFSVGVTDHGDDRFYVVCIHDAVAGCQHILTKNEGVLLVMEALTRALRVSSTPGA